MNSTETDEPKGDGVAYTQPNTLVQDFASRGLVVLSPESLGISESVHQRVYEKEKAAYLAKEPVTPSSVPDVLGVLSAPGLVSACNRLLGENWAIVPFTHNASFTSGHRDQHWHKDDNGPYNSRKQRHHQAVQIEMLYYPQAVAKNMGPTATIPYSQYWTYNHEENQDNFAGADHMDFLYMLGGMESKPVSGPDSEYTIEDIINSRTDHDIRMQDAVINTGWPLVKSFEAAPLKAGTVLLYSHNTFHRGNHRRDDWRTWQENPRFMWRFWLYRTTDRRDESPGEVDWASLGIDPLTGIDTSSADEDVTAVWRYHYHWIHTCDRPEPGTKQPDQEAEAENLYGRLHTKGEAAEAIRIGAAYRLAAMYDETLAIHHLSKALYTDRENVRRAATYGLIAVGAAATETFLEAAESAIKWVRKAGVYGLGDASPLTKKVLQIVAKRLKGDSSVYVRSVAAGTLGCLGRRAVATGFGIELISACMEALLDSLDVEENRTAMDLAQGRSIKFVRPTDDCDVCEGSGIDFSQDRFERVRSAVRENALWSVVILCSHGSDLLGPSVDRTIESLRHIIRTDENVISVGFAMDALSRLVHTGDSETVEALSDLRLKLIEIMGEAPVRPLEAIVRGGVDPQTLLQFAYEQAL